jgi:AcrR family transcriptional regulator
VGRLVQAALELFGASGYQAVPVAAIARRAGVTTGPLYHHFHDKAGLYNLVRADVERRVTDRFETAATLLAVRSVADLVPVLLTGFDYLVAAQLTRLLAEEPPGSSGRPPDPVEHMVDELLPHAARLGYLVAAVWRSALWRAGAGTDAAAQARDDLIRVLAPERAGRPEG